MVKNKPNRPLNQSFQQGCARLRYTTFDNISSEERNGLILSSIPPILWSVTELARFRRLDAVSLLAVIGIFLSLAAMALGGNPRLLLARESLVTGIIGLLFLASLLLPRPLMFYLARSTMAKETAEAAVRFESYWLKPRFVRSVYIVT